MIPNPGSFDAIALHRCACDPFANHYGAGYGHSTEGTPVFEVARGCRVHGERSGWAWSTEASAVPKSAGRPVRGVAPSSTLGAPELPQPVRTGKPGRPALPLRTCPRCGKGPRKVSPKHGVCHSCVVLARYHAKKAQAVG